MNFYEARLKQITDMFVQTLQHMQQSTELSELRSPQLAKYRIQYIGEIIQQSMNSEKERYIQSLYGQLERLVEGGGGGKGDTGNTELREQYERELGNVRKHYEELLEKSERVRETIESEVRKLIEQRIKEIERDYILKVVHQQEMKLLQVRLTDRSYTNQVTRLKSTIHELQQQIDILTSELNGYRKGLSETMRTRTRMPDREDGNSNQQGNCVLGKNHLLAIEFYGKQNASFEDECSPYKNGNMRPIEEHDDDPAKFNEMKSTFKEELEVLRNSLRNKHVEMMRGREVGTEDLRAIETSTSRGDAAYRVNASQFGQLERGEPRCKLGSPDSTSSKSLMRSPRYQTLSGQRAFCGWRKEHEDKPVKGAGRTIATYNFKYLNIKI